MATKVSNFADLIQRVTASCLLHPLAGHRADDISVQQSGSGSNSDDDNYETKGPQDAFKEDDEEEEEEFRDWEETTEGPNSQRIIEMEMLMGEVFNAVSAMKKAYVSLQQSHSPWDPDKMRVADVAIVAELRKLGVLRERFKRTASGAGGGGRERWRVGAATLREVVAPYEANLEELNKEVKAKQAEVENLREKLKTATSFNTRSGRSKGKSKRRVNCTTQG